MNPTCKVMISFISSLGKSESNSKVHQLEITHILNMFAKAVVAMIWSMDCECQDIGLFCTPSFRSLELS